MSIESERQVTRALRDLADRAGEDERHLAPPDIDSIIAQASARPRGGGWVVRSGAAAAALVTALGALLLVRAPDPPDGIVPDYITALVDSLYSDSDYVHDELVELLVGTQAPDGYMDDVWESVVTDVGS